MMLRRKTGKRLLPPGFIAFSLVQWLTLSATLSPSAIYGPQILQTPTGNPMLCGLTAACGLFLQAVAFLIRLATGGIVRGGRWVGTGVIALLVLGMQGAGAYYTRFGSYPNAVILRDFVDAPAPFLAYSASDVAFLDIVSLLIGATVAIFLVSRGARAVWAAPRPWFGLVGAMVSSTIVLGALWMAPLGRQHVFVLSEHSLPAVKYVMAALATLSIDNRVEVFESAVPRVMPASPLPSLPKARHVLLIVAEALRADHLPVYGYGRDTTPFLTADSDRWIAFRRAYAHGSRTADSFPVIFNSRYFAAVDRTSRGAQDLWTSMRAKGVRTAFLSAGAIEWGGVMKAIAFNEVDEGMMASDFPVDFRRRGSGMPFDYAVDDALLIKRYREVVSEAFGRGSSFATLHLVGSHYPFHYADTDNTFIPNLHDHGRPPVDDVPLKLRYYSDEADLTGTKLTEIANSYDNSIRHIDGLVRDAVDALSDLSLLEDSVIIVTSDHGEALGEHRTLFHGTTVYEEQVHVPLLVRVGANLGPVAGALAERSGDVAGLIDLIPTIHDLVTGGSPQPESFQGLSWLRPERKSHELLLFRGIGEMAAIVRNDRKYVFDVTGRRAEEYDLSADPAERHSLWKGDEDSAGQFLDALRRRGVL